MNFLGGCSDPDTDGICGVYAGHYWVEVFSVSVYFPFQLTGCDTFAKTS
ncbi:MAG: hypothetical protein JNJ82_04615 [Opitutaceae bacterium]|nr:hypothetical protein [Opitutaceae bacterium]